VRIITSLKIRHVVQNTRYGPAIATIVTYRVNGRQMSASLPWQLDADTARSYLAGMRT